VVCFITVSKEYEDNPFVLGIQEGDSSQHFVPQE